MRINTEPSWVFSKYIGNRVIVVAYEDNVNHVLITEKRVEGSRKVLIPVGNQFQLLTNFTKKLKFFFRSALENSAFASLRKDSGNTSERIPDRVRLSTGNFESRDCGEWFPIQETFRQAISASKPSLCWENESPQNYNCFARDLELLDIDRGVGQIEFSCSILLFDWDISGFGCQALSNVVAPLSKEAAPSLLIGREDAGSMSGAFGPLGCGELTVVRSLSPEAAPFIPISYNSFEVLDSNDDITLEEPEETRKIINIGDMIEMFNCTSYHRVMKLNALEDAAPENDEPALYTHSEGETTVFIDSKVEPIRINTSRCSKVSMLLPKLAKERDTMVLLAFYAVSLEAVKRWVELPIAVWHGSRSRFGLGTAYPSMGKSSHRWVGG
ncbi:unnamed protein product [Cuscuta campestris]|uniref:Uncharacterized protein n=1 Tax=Cuscuta campestris TaxID=132261 RepID=A0A484MP66_9ASTE|nr:unnamed protein product [Cuscuta campestris]